MARTSTSGTTRTTFMGRSISPLMCCAIRLADSTSTRPSLVLLLFDRPEDFRKGLFFGVTEILLLVLGIHSDEVYCVRSGEVVRSPARHRVSHFRDAPTEPSAYRFRPECTGAAPGRRQYGAPFRPALSRQAILPHHVDSAGTGTSGAYLNCTAALPQLQPGAQPHKRRPIERTRAARGGQLGSVSTLGEGGRQEWRRKPALSSHLLPNVLQECRRRN